MAVQLAPLFSLEKQFVAKDGALNTAGWLKVFLAATDDPAETFADYYGTPNPEKIILDDNGRAVVICDKAKAYRLEVYDADGMLLWTEEPVYCSGTGGGGVSVTTVESTDGSIAVESSVVGSNRIYDLSIAPDNAKELLEWVKTENTAISDGPVRPVYVEGTMDVYSGQGIGVSDTGLYHVTVNLDVIPSGNGINYETLSVFLMLDDGSDTPVTLCQHDFDVDNSLSDKVELEFAYDLTGKGDGKLYFVVSGASAFHNVEVSLQMHRIYSGIAAVPGSIASKAWVEQNISSKIDYSALEYNQQNLITAISGSAIASDPVNPNEFVPWSASGTFQSSGSYLSSTDSALFQPSGNYLSASESSNYYPMTGNPSGFIRDEECQSSYLAISSFSSYSSDVESSITSISSVVSGLTGVYLEQSASSLFQPSGSYVSASDMSSYVPYSAISGEGNTVTSINGSSIKGHEYEGVYPIGVDNTADKISIDTLGFGIDNVTLTATSDENGVVIGVANNLYQPSGDYAYNSSLSSKLDTSAFSSVSGNFLTAVPAGYATESYVDSGLSSKLDVTASSQFITALPSDLATTSDVASAVSGKLDNSASGEWYPMTGNPSGFLTAHQSLAGYATEQYVDSAVSGKLDTSAYDSAQFLQTSQSGIFQPSGQYLSATESSNYYPSSNPSGFITGVDLSPYQLTADMSGYYTTANESGFIDAASASAIASAYSDSAFSGKQDASAMTAYQEVSGMTAYQEISGMTAYQPAGDYQPSGDYIFVSALGWAEV